MNSRALFIPGNPSPPIRCSTSISDLGGCGRNEYFDRIVRDDKEFGQRLEYIVENPWKRWLNLDHYPWGVAATPVTHLIECGASKKARASPGTPVPLFLRLVPALDALDRHLLHTPAHAQF
jgi:hypothetical protein